MMGLGLDSELLGLVLKGLNRLESGEIKEKRLSGWSIVEASDIKDNYLTNYNVKMTHTTELNKNYLLEFSKKN